MSNWRIEAGKAAWNAIKPLAKTGAKTVSEWKNKASLAKLKTAGDAAAQRIKAAAKNKIPFLTLYTFSTENWQRPESEINFLKQF